MATALHANNTAKLISLLNSGVTQSEAAIALGITPSAVSQQVSDPHVASQLTTVQTEQLERSTKLDEGYDRIEQKLVDQLEKTIPLLMRPEVIAKVLTQVNSAKRRGAGHIRTNQGPNRILTLNIPIALQQRFVVDARNQVIEAGDQTLVTMPSANIPKMAEVQNAKVTHTLAAPRAAEEDEFGLS